MAWQIGVDVGGTFTDLLALDPERSVFRVAKVPSTPEDQSVGFIAGLAVLETDLAAVAALVHGTTVATNAVLERKGSAVRADYHRRVSRRARARSPHTPILTA